MTWMSIQQPLWGGISVHGFSPFFFHDEKKVCEREWAEMVRAGELKVGLRLLNPSRTHGPWTIVCDSESFLHSKGCAATHRRASIHLWHIPARSPDLNPIEKFWSWLRRRLRALDLQDYIAKRPPLGKTAYKYRVRLIARSDKAKEAASNVVNGLFKVCIEVSRKRGAASQG